MSTEDVHDLAETETKVNVVNERAGHRAYVTKIIGKAKELLDDFKTENTNKLMSYKKKSW